MSPWRGWVLAVLTIAVSAAGILLFMDVNAAATGEADEFDDELLGEAAQGIETERITPPGPKPPPRPPPPRPRPRPSSSSASPDPVTPPTFRLGGIPPVPGQEGMEGGDEDLQKQLATRRLAALERRVRAMNRRIESMTKRESAPERIDAQRRRMESLLEEVQEKRREMGMPPFDPDETD